MVRFPYRSSDDIEYHYMNGARPDDLSGFVEFGEKALAEAALLLERYFRNTSSTAKGPFDVVTEADHAVEVDVRPEVGSGLPRSCHGRRGNGPAIATSRLRILLGAGSTGRNDQLRGPSALLRRVPRAFPSGHAGDRLGPRPGPRRTVPCSARPGGDTQ